MKHTRYCSVWSGLSCISLFCLLFFACEKPTLDTTQVPFFATDTAGDRVIRGTGITYQIYQDQLYPYRTYDSTIREDPAFWSKQLNNQLAHQAIFSLFSSLIPAQYRTQIQYLSIMEPPADDFATMANQKSFSLSAFTLTVRPDLLTYQDSIPAFKAPSFSLNTLGYSLAVYSLIHEYGHYVTLNSEQAYLFYHADANQYSSQFKAGSIGDSIQTRYWRSMATDDIFTTCLPKYGRLYFCVPTGEFVSSYASVSPNEDAAESFAHFVLLTAKPPATTHANRKILLFYQDAKLVRLREAIRANLQRTNIVPRSPNFRL